MPPINLYELGFDKVYIKIINSSNLRLFQGSIHLDKRVYRPFFLLHDVFR